MGQVVGYVGLGDMGAPIAWRIHGAGWELAVLNRTRSKMQPYVEAGAKGAENPRDMGARCDVVFLCLDRLEAIEVVVFGEAGPGAGNLAGQVRRRQFHPAPGRGHLRRRARQRVRRGGAPASGRPPGGSRERLCEAVEGGGGDTMAMRRYAATFEPSAPPMSPQAVAGLIDSVIELWPAAEGGWGAGPAKDNDY